MGLCDFWRPAECWTGRVEVTGDLYGHRRLFLGSGPTLEVVRDAAGHMLWWECGERYAFRDPSIGGIVHVPERQDGQEGREGQVLPIDVGREVALAMQSPYALADLVVPEGWVTEAPPSVWAAGTTSWRLQDDGGLVRFTCHPTLGAVLHAHVVSNVGQAAIRLHHIEIVPPDADVLRPVGIPTN